MSSWLRRVADCYGMFVEGLLEHGLGETDTTEKGLDLDPPPQLLAALAERTGVDPDRLRQMTLAGWTPWLLDGLEPSPAAFDTYVRQFHVLLRPGRRSTNPVGPWRAWITEQPAQRGCPVCLADPDRQGLLLMWRLPLMLSCPEHGCLLQQFVGLPGHLAWVQPEDQPRPATAAVQAMDRRTHHALTRGHVQLPRRSVHAAVWFRLLRTLIDELSTPATYWGGYTRDLRRAWASCEHPVRAGQATWRPFESYPWPVQAQHLEATAATIDLLCTGALQGRGTHARLFAPAPQVPLDNGDPPAPVPTGNDVPERWAAVTAALEEAIAAARRDPANAQALYDFIRPGCRTPQAVERALATLNELGIPTEHLSHNNSQATVDVRQSV